ncbi:MAG: penicillin-binding transpeptidase domain-containing protein, partial [Acidobacteriota bacterium]|nr:penicillin-binding transpeptidase domain-containing protein [Acidobacteriota bacterium]
VLDRDGSPLEEWQPVTYKVVSEYVALTMVDMMRGVTAPGGTAPAASTIGVQVAGKTGTVNDHTDVWFIGYTPTYVTGVWMGYPGYKKNLGSDMTGGHGALPIWIDYMKDFLKDKPKETFEKPPTMPEDIKDLFQQRQREMREEQQAESAQISRARGDREGTTDPSAAPIDTRLEPITLPPPATDIESPRPAPASEPAPKHAPPAVVPETSVPTLAPEKPATRPREVEPVKKKGKKGGNDNTDH